jgi:cysteine-rich repeat protein
MHASSRRVSIVCIAFSYFVSACGGEKSTQPRDASTELDATSDRPTDPQNAFVIPDVAADLRMDRPGPFCGDGYVDRNEECDDGNTLSDDGCSSRCQIENDWPPGCPAGGCTRKPVCGDGRLTSNEACDDGDHEGGDGCSADCQAVEPGWRCRAPGRPCTPICGDQTLEGSETCDDGNTASGDGCSAYCLTEPGWDCTGGACTPLSDADGGDDSLDGSVDGGTGHPRCGDGIMSGAEECDLGDLNADGIYGGCNTRCFYDSFCGDGIVNGPEECDLGKNNGSSSGKGACTLGCTNAHYCGDGMVDVTLGEECDLGEKNGLWLDKEMDPTDDGDPWITKFMFCSSDCSIPACCVY